MIERGGWKPRPVEEKFDAVQAGGVPGEERDRLLPARVGENKPSVEVSASAEEVARQMAVQVENIAAFIHRERPSEFSNLTHMHEKYRIPDTLQIFDFKAGLWIRSLVDPIQGVIGGEFYTTDSSGEETYKNLTELSIPPPDLEWAFQEFGFTPLAELTFPWHFDEPTLPAACKYAQTNPDDVGSGSFSTSYFFDKEGHFTKLSLFPPAIPDNRPNLYRFSDTHPDKDTYPYKEVLSPITEWDLAVAPGAVTMLERKIKNLRLREE